MPDAFFRELLILAGPAAAATALVIAVLIWALHRFGVIGVVGKSAKVVEEGELSEVTGGISGITKRIDLVNNRLATVERDLEKRATREEIHALEISVTRMEERFTGGSTRIEATAHGVNRIENFMYEAALRARGEKQ